MIFAQFNDTAELFQRQLVVLLSINDLGVLEMENMVLRLEHEDFLHAECCLSIPRVHNKNSEIRNNIEASRADNIPNFRVISPKKKRKLTSTLRGTSLPIATNPQNLCS